jgi:hypothetical protein
MRHGRRDAGRPRTPARGARLWAKRYNGPGNANDHAYSAVVGPVTGTVFVTGLSVGSGSSADDATIAYHG